MNDTNSPVTTIPETSVSAKPDMWRQALLLLGFALLWILFWYRGTASAMVTIWLRSETFTHGFVVPPIVLWLIWRQRHEVARLTPRPNAWMSLLLVGSGFGWLLGELAAVNAVAQLAFTALLVLAVPALLGLQVARALAFPLAFLFFAVPIGEFVMPQLMEWTANFTVLGLRLSGIPVYREGLQFVIPSGSWSVVEACSGVRYLIASLTVGTLFAYLNYHSLKRRLIFIGVSIVVPVFANWMRAYIIVMLGHLSGNKLAAGVDHLIYGWLFFGLVIMIMFLIGARWAENPPAGAPMPEPALGSGSGLGAALWRATALVAALAAVPHLAYWMIERSDAAVPPRLAGMAADVGSGWRQADQPIASWHPAFENPSAASTTAFGNDGKIVGVYLGYYRNQDYSRKLVSSDNVLVKSKDPVWARVGSGTRTIAFGRQQVTVRTAELRGAGIAGQVGESRLTVWQLYWVNGRLTASDHLAKAYTALSRLLGQGDDSAVIILYAPKDQSGGGEAALEAFSQVAGEAIEAALQQTKQDRQER